MAVEMTHPEYGVRTVSESQVEDYLNVGWTKGAEVPPDPVAGTREQVLARVGDDVEAARVALLAEQERPNPRTSLVTALARIAEPNTTEES